MTPFGGTRLRIKTMTFLYALYGSGGGWWLVMGIIWNLEFRTSSWPELPLGCCLGWAENERPRIPHITVDDVTRPETTREEEEQEAGTGTLHTYFTYIYFLQMRVIIMAPPQSHSPLQLLVHHYKNQYLTFVSYYKCKSRVRYIDIIISPHIMSTFRKKLQRNVYSFFFFFCHHPPTIYALLLLLHLPLPSSFVESSRRRRRPGWHHHPPCMLLGLCKNKKARENEEMLPRSDTRRMLR